MCNGSSSFFSPRIQHLLSLTDPLHDLPCFIKFKEIVKRIYSPEDITCYFTGMESVYEMNQVMSAKLATFGAAGLSGWRVMNRTESDYVYNHVDVVNQALESIENSQPLVSGKRYLWFDGTSYFAMKLGQVMQGNDWSSSTLIRPVVTVTL